MIESWQLRQRQSLSLEEKIQFSNYRIQNWYERWEGNVYIGFSGGKDSTVLLDMVRKLYPEVPAVFVNTGLEFPEIVQFVKKTPNVTYIKPKLHFSQVLDKYGYPVISKLVAMGFDRFRNTKSELQKQLRLHGGINPTSGKKQYRTIPKKWHYLTEAPFKISDKCCDIMKKTPLNRYNKETGRYPYIGTMAVDSTIRQERYLKYGCNAYDTKHPISTPLGIWNQEDIWKYLKKYNIPYSKIYNMGYHNTGCVGCLFGIHLEKGENRIQLMKKTHPKLYTYCVDTLGIGKVLDYMNITY